MHLSYDARRILLIVGIGVAIAVVGVVTFFAMKANSIDASKLPPATNNSAIATPGDGATQNSTGTGATAGPSVSSSASAGSDPANTTAPTIGGKDITSTASSNGAVTSIQLKNLRNTDKPAAGVAEENYTNGLKARHDGNAQEAIAYFLSAVTSKDPAVSMPAASSLAQLQYLVEHNDNRLPVEDPSRYQEGETKVSEDGNFTQGTFSLPVKAGDTVVVKKQQYQVLITITDKDNKPSYFTIVTN